VSGDVLSLRALNRATLDRQLLLRRSDLSPYEAVEHLVGMQAQVPSNPYLGLWSRLTDFQPDDLAQLLLDRKVVRTVVMRSTLHLVTADDCLVLRPLMQPVLDQELARHPEFGPPLRGVDLEPVLAFARDLMAVQPRTGTQLRAAIAERFPDVHAAAAAQACRNWMALVQVPPRGLWGRSGQVTSTTAESWLGRPLAAEPSIDDVVIRYFAAFGPATVADVAAWSRLTGLREVVDRVRPQLRPFRDARDRELFDVPDAPRPDPDTPAPPRFLPEYDNVVLSHADRSRFFDQRATSFDVTTRVGGAVLHDGLVIGLWRIERAAGSATLVIDHVVRLTKRATTAIAAEGNRMLQFLALDGGSATDLDVRFVAVGD
jgi:Winged helix DNA-binding domain